MSSRIGTSSERVKDTRKIPVELIVNGIAVDKKLITADGRIEDLQFEYTPERSSWGSAARVSSVAHEPDLCGGRWRPIRASKRSAEWCLEAVDRCWKSKSKKIRDGERPAAQEAYDHAKMVYQQISAESYNDEQK